MQCSPWSLLTKGRLMLRQLATAFAVLALGLGCGQPQPPDAGQEDAGEEDAGFDAGLDDAGFDAGFDAGVDAGFDAGIPTNSQEHREMLRGLGFSTNVGERVSADGGVLPARWHPLRTHYASFFPRKEIYVAGGPVLAGQPELFLDDKVANYAALPLAREPDQTWIQAQFKNGIAVDLDDDGLDELFIVYFAPGSGTLKYIVLDPNDNSTPINGVIALNTRSDSLDALTQPSIAAGDLDGDGKAEIAIGFGNLYILEGDGDGQFTVRTRSFTEFNDVNVAIGNIDQDPQDELIVTHTETRTGNFRGYYEIFDGSLTNPLEDGELQFVDYNGTDTHFGETRIAIGDIDGDRMPDIVFHGRRIIPGDNAWFLFAMQYRPIVPRPTDKHFVFRSFIHYTNATGTTTPRTLVVADFDGDGTREMFGWGQVISYRDANSGTVKYAGVPGWTRAVSANIDGDRRDDLLVTTNTALQIWGLDALDNWVRKTEIAGTGVAYDSPVLATPNADGDSALVRYDGDYELLFTDPQLVTVMASPPWQEGVGQDIASTTATFGPWETRW